MEDVTIIFKNRKIFAAWVLLSRILPFVANFFQECSRLSIVDVLIKLSIWILNSFSKSATVCPNDVLQILIRFPKSFVDIYGHQRRQTAPTQDSPNQALFLGSEKIAIYEAENQ